MGSLGGPHDARRDLWAAGRRSGMYARVSTIEGSPDKVDDVTRQTQEQTLPQLRQMEGFKGFVALGDRQSGKMIGVSFWESEEALRATDEAASSVRSGAAEAADGTVASVEEYEVFVNEAPSAGPLGAVTGTVGGVTDTVGGATQPVSGVTDTVSGATDTLGGTTGNLLGGGEKKS
jgi:heme-degrading monooxygenase HmoA